MSRGFTLPVVIVMIGLFWGSNDAVVAQSDAEKAMQSARVAFENEQFERARELSNLASQTDANNPDVWLLLGKAHFELGQLDAALTAWRTLLKLAPDHQYAARMVAALEGRNTDIAARLAVLPELIEGGMFDLARAHLTSISQSSLTAEQQNRVLMLTASLAIAKGESVVAMESLTELQARSPAVTEESAFHLLRAQSRLGMGGTSKAIALAELSALAGGDTPEARVAELELILDHLASVNEAPTNLAEWIAANDGHPRAVRARQTLVSAWLNVTRQLAVPNHDSELADSDRNAVAAAADLMTRVKSSEENAILIQTLVQHFQTHYFDRGAPAAAISGMQLLVPLEGPVRRGALLHTLLAMQRTLALAELQSAAAAGTLPSTTAPLPELLDAATKTAALINGDYPATSAWKSQAELAGQILDVAGAVPWPTRISEPKAAHGWAISLALPVVSANSDPEATVLARSVIDRVVSEISGLTQPTAVGLATKVHAELLANLPAEHALWPDIAMRHAMLLSADANRTFDDNMRSGEGSKNAATTETQDAIVKLLSDVVTRRPAMVQPASDVLAAHLTKWLEARHDAVVESLWSTFAANQPPNAQRRTRLMLAGLRFEQVRRSHAAVIANGFQVPRGLDELSQQALQECYRLAAILGADDPLLPDVRNLRSQIISHYLAFDYADVAEAAIRVKPEEANAVLDEEAELELAALQKRTAERELARLLEQHDGRKQIVLTPAFSQAVKALKKFIIDHPNSERVTTAADGVFAVGGLFEQHEAWLVAAQVYADFEIFATTVESLNQNRSNQATYPERAALARAKSLHTRASRALEAWSKSKPDDASPPVVLSDEFKDAQAAWQKVIADYQQRPAAQTAIVQIMAIAQEYARINAWDVADATYGELLGLNLPLHAPERLEFARAVCRLGKVLPEHAHAVLAALVVTGNSESTHKESDGPPSGEAMLSMANVPGAAAVGDLAVADTAAATVNGVPASSFGSSAGSGGPGGGGFGGGGIAADRQFMSESDAQLMVAVQTQLDRQAQQVAMLRDDAIAFRHPASTAPNDAPQQSAEMPAPQTAVAAAVLSDAELQRQQDVLDRVYADLQAIRKNSGDSRTARQARDEILIIVNHWREIAQWDRAAALARRFLDDNPTDNDLPKIRQEIARDWLAWASLGVRDPKLNREELLTEISRRFETARNELLAILTAFPDETAVRHQAQWDIATSYLTQARVVAESSPTLARGQFVRAARELLQVSEKFHDHPQIGTIPDMLWAIAGELEGRSYHDEAITVWNELQIRYAAHALADQSALRIAQTWQHLGQPLRAAEAFLELNFARGGNDPELQNAILQIAVNLKNEKRWIESLHVLQTFVDSFPSHESSGQSLTMIGQIHQVNEVWGDAIEAYRRVIDEFPTGTWTIEARWSIAECTINLSRWQEAAGAYAEFRKSYPEDGRVAEAERRIEVLKKLERYQDVIDEPGQRKAFDAQFQLATIVRTELANPVKAIIEYREVAQKWPESHMADDALFEIGKIYLERGETELARAALLQSAERYPESPLADDALLMVGTSYVSQADLLTAVDRSKSQEIAKDIAQKQAYHVAQGNRRRQIERNVDQINELKKQGKSDEAANKEAYFAGQALQFDAANTLNASNWAAQQEEVLSAAQLADRQDKINAALRKAVGSFRRAATVTAADKADDALLQMAQIYDERLKDTDAAMSTWEEIVRQYSGTAVAEDASWKMATNYESQMEHAKAIAAYQAFFRNYRRSERAGQAQAAIAENYEQLGEWVQAMDAYTNYVNNFPEGPLLEKAREQINWIKTYRL